MTFWMDHEDLAAVRANFSLSTWLLLGACSQTLVFLLAPYRVVFLPAFGALAIRAIYVLLVGAGYIHNSHMDGVHMGKWTAVLSHDPSKGPGKPNGEDLVVFILSARSNQ